MSDNSSIRKASYEDSLYCSNQQELSRQLDNWLKGANNNEVLANEVDLVNKLLDLSLITIKAIIAPYDGYAYSGSVAASSYKYIQPRYQENGTFANMPKTIFQLGPYEYINSLQCGISTYDEVETPLGNQKVDREICEQLLTEFPELFVACDKDVDDDEYCLETQYPFIKKIFTGCKSDDPKSMEPFEYNKASSEWIQGSDSMAQKKGTFKDMIEEDEESKEGEESQELEKVKDGEEVQKGEESPELEKDKEGEKVQKGEESQELEKDKEGEEVQNTVQMKNEQSQNSREESDLQEKADETRSFIRDYQAPKIVPIYVGHIPEEKEKECASALQKYFEDKTSTFICVTNLCRWGQKYNFTDYDSNSGEIHHYIKKMDTEMISLIEKQSPELFINYVKSARLNICGKNVIGILLNMMNNSANTMKIQFEKYVQSQKVVDTNDNSVSYGVGFVYSP